MQNGDVYEYNYGERNRLESIRVTKKGEETDRLFAEYEYDANGNTTRRTIHPMNSKSQVLELEYDTLNRLVQSRLDGAMTSYSYDNAGNRLVKTTPEKTTLYLRHGQIAVAMDIELPEDASVEKGRVNRYVLSGDLLAGRVTRVTAADGVESVEKSYYHLDHLNSTKAVTDDDGVLEVLYEYRAFGEQLKRLDSSGSETDDSAKYSYGGKELDGGSDLYYFNARYYDATIGRFINVDPIQDGSNWYVYVRNNPLGLRDPTGLSNVKGTQIRKRNETRGEKKKRRQRYATVTNKMRKEASRRQHMQRINEDKTKRWKSYLRNYSLNKATQHWPANGRISSPYGYRSGQFAGFHPATDIAAPTGTPIVASGPGTVVYVLRDPEHDTFGKTLSIDHGNNTTTHYSHNSKILVEIGDRVKGGQQIAEMDNTGLSSGPHLDCIIRTDGVQYLYYASRGETVDPEDWLPER